MNKEKTTKILREFNRWRRAEDEYDKIGTLFPYTPSELGEAIDFACDELEETEETTQEKESRIAYCCKHCGRIFDTPISHVCYGTYREANAADFDKVSIY